MDRIEKAFNDFLNYARQQGIIPSRLVWAYPEKLTSKEDAVIPNVLPLLYNVCAKLGVRVEYRSTEDEPPQRPCFGEYTPSKQLLTLYSHEPVAYWHEIVHIAHETSLGQVKFERLDDDHREAVAILGSGIINEIYGDDTGRYQIFNAAINVKNTDPNAFPDREITLRMLGLAKSDAINVCRLIFGKEGVR